MICKCPVNPITNPNPVYSPNKRQYCNVDNEALLGNGPVKQQWKGSDRCYAITQYTGVNNGVKDAFCMVGAAVI
jgi:hypothetical protein